MVVLKLTRRQNSTKKKNKNNYVSKTLIVIIQNALKKTQIHVNFNDESPNIILLII